MANANETVVKSGNPVPTSESYSHTRQKEPNISEEEDHKVVEGVRREELKEKLPEIGHKDDQALAATGAQVDNSLIETDIDIDLGPGIMVSFEIGGELGQVLPPEVENSVLTTDGATEKEKKPEKLSIKVNKDDQ